MLTNPHDAMLYIYIIGSDDARPSYCVFSIFKKVAVRHLWFSYFRIFLWKIQICAYFYVVMQNLVKIVRCAAELLRILYFQNGGRPPSWIWYDVIADHPRLVLDGHIILLKLQVHRVNILRDIEIFKYLARLSWNGLFTPIFGVLGIWRGSPWIWVPAQGVKN